MKKPFSKTFFGNIIWKLGDTFKGKTKTGKVMDAALEVLPVPNPIRYAREADQQNKLKKLNEVNAARHVADAAGIDLSDMIDDSPTWVRPTLAFAALIGLLILVGMKVIEPALLIEGLKAIFGN